MAYTTTTNVGNYLKRTLSAGETTYLNDVLIPAVKAWIDKKLGSNFDSAIATTRTFDGCGLKSIDIDPCTNITAVRSVDYDGDEQTLYTSGEDYVAYPLNETVKRELRARGRHWPKGFANIEVDAIFSEYADGNAVPGDIVSIATAIVAGMLAGSTNAEGVESESIEGHTVKYTNESIDKIAMSDPSVVSLLELRKDVLLG